MSETVKYYKVKDRDDEIKVSIGYELGGYNWYNGQYNSRGYYMYVQSVVRKTDETYGYKSEITTMFEGHKQLLISVDRKGKKSFEKAIEKSQSLIFDFAQMMANEKGWIMQREF